MANIVRRRNGRGFEREIQTLTKLRTAIVIDDNIDLESHVACLHHIDALIAKLGELIKRGVNIETPLRGPVSTNEPTQPVRQQRAKKSA